MAARNKGGVAALHRHYDKLIAVLVLVGLLVSLVYLSQSSQRRQRDRDVFERALARLEATHPKSARVEQGPYLRAQERLENPFQMALATNKPFLVAEERVWCIECRRPIRFDADVCPYCQTAQPGSTVPEEWDSDGDGMPDSWERKYGLNPLDPADAHHDKDGDGFTNLEEFVAGTDPADPGSHPPRIDFLRVSSIREVPFPLILRGTFKGPDGKVRFQIQDKQANQDFYVSVGDAIGKSGFTIDSTEIRKEKRVVPGWTDEREVDVHVAMVKRGETVVALEEGAPGKSSDYSIVFECTKDREKTEYKAESGKEFSFDQDMYEVISVDSHKHNIVIRRVSDKKEFSVPRL